MTWLAGLVETGRIADLLAAIVIAEIVALLALRGRGGIRIVTGLLPGLALILALRAALTGAEASVVIAWVTASLPLHLADLRLRMKE
jgi:hypothetical protein